MVGRYFRWGKWRKSDEEDEYGRSHFEKLEERMKHPIAVIHGNIYDLDEGKIRVRYFVDNIDYKEDGLYGELYFVLEVWDEDYGNFVPFFYDNLEKKLLYDNERGGYYHFDRNSFYDKQDEVRKHYANMFLLEYERLKDMEEIDEEDRYLISSEMLEDTLNGLLESIKTQYHSHYQGDVY